MQEDLAGFTCAIGHVLAPKQIANEDLIRNAYATLRNALNIRSMLKRTCLPVGFAALLAPFFEQRVAQKPHAIVTSIEFTASNPSNSVGGRTTNVYHALLAVFRLILDYNAQCKRHEDRIYSVACPNLCPSMPVREQAQQIYRAFTTATRRDTVPGHFIQQRFYVPDSVACGAQERCDAHLEFEPFFEGYLEPRITLEKSDDDNDKDERWQRLTIRNKSVAVQEQRGEVALSRWRNVNT